MRIRARKAEGRVKSGEVDVEQVRVLAGKISVAFGSSGFRTDDELPELFLHVRLLACHQEAFSRAVRLEVGYLLQQPLRVLLMMVVSCKASAVVVLVANCAAVRASHQLFRHETCEHERELGQPFQRQWERGTVSCRNAHILRDELIEIVLAETRLRENLQVDGFLQKVETFFGSVAQVIVIDSV